MQRKLTDDELEKLVEALGSIAAFSKIWPDIVGGVEFWSGVHSRLTSMCAYGTTDGKPAEPIKSGIKAGPHRSDCGVWMTDASHTESVARRIAEYALRALSLDVNNFRLRDSVIAAIESYVGNVLDAVAGLTSPPVEPEFEWEPPTDEDAKGRPEVEIRTAKGTWIDGGILIRVKPVVRRDDLYPFVIERSDGLISVCRFCRMKKAQR